MATVYAEGGQSRPDPLAAPDPLFPSFPSPSHAWRSPADPVTTSLVPTSSPPSTLDALSTAAVDLLTPRPLAQSVVLSRISSSPTLLPENLAKLVTALSLAARVTLRASALFIEAILETLQGSTVASLGVTRRALIAAVGSARALHYVKGGLDWSGRDEDGKKTDDAFLTLLDKYTNLGIYLIHHSFTLAELFTMSSFYLTLNTVQTVSTAADESVRMLDSILGSNESSRALSSIITLVRHELTQDPRSELAQRGTIASLAALTKAITAFACLQTATHRRTLKELKMRVVYDCTIVIDHDGGETGSDSDGEPVRLAARAEEPSLDHAGRYAGPSTASKKRKRASLHMTQLESAANDLLPEGERGVLTDVRTEYERFTQTSRMGSRATSEYGETPRAGRSRTTSKAASVYSMTERVEMDVDRSTGNPGGGDDGFRGLDDVGLGLDVPGEAEIVQELTELCGLPDITTSTTTTVDLADTWDEDGPIDESELPDEVRLALKELEEDARSTTNSEGTERRYVRPVHGRGFSYEIEVEETMTTTTTTVRTIEEVSEGGNRILSSRTRERQLPSTDATGNDQAEGFDADEWIEIARGRKDGLVRPPDLMEVDGDEDDFDDLPSASNGRGRFVDVAIRSRKEALNQPAENRQKLQVVLSTMTKRFTQRKRTVRRLSSSTSRTPSPALPSPAASSPSSSPIIGWSRSERNPVDDLKSHVTTPLSQPNKTRSVFRAISKPFRPSPISGESRVSSPPSEDRRPLEDATSTPLGSSRSPYSTPRATPSPGPGSHSGRVHQRTISASTLGPPSAPRPPQDLPPQPKPLPVQTSAGDRTRDRRSCDEASSAVVATRTPPPTPRVEEVEPKATNFPHQHLVKNLQHFARYSSAAYGQSFLRILGLAKSEFKFPHTEIHANNHSFAHHVGIDVEDILLSSFTDPQPNLSNEKISPIVNYVAVDHSLNAVVLSCRGSLGLSDILVDLTCDYEPIPVPDADPHGSYHVHSGMFLSATTLQQGTVHDVIKEALERYPTYGLVICGHSLGGGVGALLSILWSAPAEAFRRRETILIDGKGRPPPHPEISTPFVTSFSSGLPPGRPIACYTYGVPCVASPDLAAYARGLIISTVHNYDIVPTLSIGVLRDLKTMAMGFYAETGVAEEIVGRVVGLCQRRFMAKRAAGKTASLPSPPRPDDDELLTPEALTDPSEESRLVPLTDRELRTGRSANKALDPTYTDPSLLGPDMADDVELSDWLWSLRKTIRASSDNEKLYPPGTVYIVENYTVFISSDSSDGKYSRREGRRVLLRAVDDVERRFSEPIFSRSMLSDHSPVNYESNCDLLAAAAM
ncbi:hypothetical protein JCM10212_002402 [Sporobolomyces blumeae]